MLYPRGKELYELKTPIQLIRAVFNRLYYYCCPDKIYLNKRYKEVFGRSIDWDNPITYNEKLQWLKIHDRCPLYIQLVDKYEVRSFISDVIGDKYLVPCLGVWDKFEDIDFDTLPNQFVLKCTHDSNSVCICKDKSIFDYDRARSVLNTHLKTNFYYNAREWPYKKVKPRIIAEAYLEDSKTSELRDYKIFTFNGVPKAMFIASDRLVPGEETKFDFFDSNFNWLDVRQGHPNSKFPPEKPDNFELMMTLASKIAKGFCEARIDFYECNGRLYFGEITFFHHSGFVPFDPPEWDLTFGNWIDISSVL